MAAKGMCMGWGKGPSALFPVPPGNKLASKEWEWIYFAKETEEEKDAQWSGRRRRK